jgi:hypothetical protein
MTIQINAVGISILLMFVGSALTWVAARYWFNRNVAQKMAEKLEDTRVDLAKQIEKDREAAAVQLAKDHAQLVTDFRAMEAKLAVLSAAVVPISTAFQAILIKELTHFHTPRMDELLAKVGPGTLTADEERELAVALLQREADMGELITASERDAAHILPLVITRAKAEAELMKGKPVLFKLVTVPPETAEVLPLALNARLRLDDGDA